MGKRSRRRNREKVKAARRHQQAAPPDGLPPETGPSAPAPESNSIYFPSVEKPLLRVDIHPGTPPDLRAVCRAYWEFAEPGKWTRNVAAIGVSSYVSATVKAACTATLLMLLCPKCGEPRQVTNRSDMATTGLWKPYGMPGKPTRASWKCAACLDAERAAETARREAEDAQAQRRTDQRRQNAGAWLNSHQHHECWGEAPSLLASLALVAIAGIVAKNGRAAIGPMQSVKYTLTGSLEQDVEILKELHQNHWLAPTGPAPMDAFAFDDDDNVRGVYVEAAPWRLAHWAGDTADAAHDIPIILDAELECFDDLDAIQNLLHEKEAEMVVSYLDGILQHRYNEVPIPEVKLPEAHETAVNALRAGFTLRQMLAVAWSAVSRSAAWGARTEWIKPGMVSSAAVTNLGKGVGFASDRGVQEYEVPKWLWEPAVLSPARRILKHRAEQTEMLARFQALQQRIASRPEGPVDFHDELDETLGSKDFGEQFQEWVEELKSGVAENDTSPPLTYAIVMPNGEMAIKAETVRTMRDEVSLPGAGFVDRILIDGSKTVHAYVGELVPRTREFSNPVAVEMLCLLGEDSNESVFGPVAFFQVRPGNLTPSSLDAEHQELLTAAHEAAASRLRPST